MDENVTVHGGCSVPTHQYIRFPSRAAGIITTDIVGVGKEALYV